jgi:hypothetical protein
VLYGDEARISEPEAVERQQRERQEQRDEQAAADFGRDGERYAREPAER